MGRTRAFLSAERDQIVELLDRLECQDAREQLQTASALAWIGIQARKRGVAVRGRLSSAARGRVDATHFASALQIFPNLPLSVRREAAMALGDLAGSVAVDELARLTSAPDVGTRLIAVDALGKIGGPQAVAALKAAVGDVNETIRAEAVRALGQLTTAEKEAETPEKAAVEALLLAVSHDEPSEYVREIAGEALAAIYGSDSRESGALRDQSPVPMVLATA